MESAFTIQLLNAFLPDLFSLLDPLRIFRYHVLSRFARSQEYCNSCALPVDFSLPLRFANTIKTVALATLYAPILPISPFIGLGSVLISYLADACAASADACAGLQCP